MSKKYLSCAETSKLARLILKETFPGIKFSVRSDTYSMGASMRVGWTDGPTEKQVKHAVEPLEGAYFDGMIDYKGYISAELDGESVHFGADFIFCDRMYSEQTTQAIINRLAIKYHASNTPSAEDFNQGRAYNVSPFNNWGHVHANAWQGLIHAARHGFTLFPCPRPSKTRDRVKVTGDDGYSRQCGAGIDHRPTIEKQ